MEEAGVGVEVGFAPAWGACEGPVWGVPEGVAWDLSCLSCLSLSLSFCGMGGRRGEENHKREDGERREGRGRMERGERRVEAKCR